jgi:hypothetical protein
MEEKEEEEEDESQTMYLEMCIPSIAHFPLLPW